MLDDETRPPIDEVTTATEFERWYWSVDHLKTKCEALELPQSGSKAELRARIAFALANPGAPLPKPAKPTRAKGSFWSKSVLSKESVITEDISFGPNVRGFFKAQIGKGFVCHSDFMDWVKDHPGATLGDAIEAWHVLEDRKLDPAFRREIAECNNYLRYLRDIRDHHPELSLQDAMACWDQKKIRPAVEGFVTYDPSDLAYLDGQ